jgi:hypothetical protein
MGDGVSDGGNGDEPLFLAAPEGSNYAVSFDDAMDEEVEILERKQKILGKIICIPGATIHVADIMKNMFAILKDIDNQAIITTASGLVIKSIKGFPEGTKFKDAFKPVLSADNKNVKMIFNLTTAPTFKSIKSGNVRLLDFLREKRLYLDESFSGSDNEELIGYLLGFQADKVHLTGLSDDLREIISKIALQEGEIKIGQEAESKLPWSSEGTIPPFYLRVRNITRYHNKEEFASKAIGIIVAEEHATFFRTLLTRATDEKLIPGLGLYYNVIPNDRQFYKAIKWQNDVIDKTSILPILGITRQAMLHPINVRISKDSKETVVTSLRAQIHNSGYFTSIHSTHSTYNEGRWILIVADSTKTEKASKHINTLMKSIYATEKSQIPDEARLLVYPVPMIEGKTQTMARITNPIRTQQASAWGPVFDSNDTKGGSRLRNLPTRKKQQQVRKIVELSFDPESATDFPHLQSTSKKSNEEKETTKSAAKSTTSSHSSVSGVTKADFQTLGDELRQMLQTEVKSVMTSGTDLTMVTLMKEEMVASRLEAQEIRKQDQENRKQDQERAQQQIQDIRKQDQENRKLDQERAQQQMNIMQTQMSMFQTAMTAILPKANHTANSENNASENKESESNLAKSPPNTSNQSVSKESASNQSESESAHSADTQVTQTTNHEHNTRSRHRESKKDTPASPVLTQRTENLTEPSPLRLMTQPPDNTAMDELMQKQQAHNKPVSTGATPPPKKSRSTGQKLPPENRNLGDEFDDVQTFHESADSQGAAGGGL